MKFLLSYLKPHKAFIAVTLIIKTLATLIELAIPYILSYIIDYVVPLGKIPPVILWGGVMILCAALACIGNIIANRRAANVARRSTQNIRHDLFARTMTLSNRQIDSFTIPSLESRLTSDTYHIHHLVGMSMRIGVRAPLLLIGGIALTFTLDPLLTLVMIAVLPLICISVTFISKKGVPLFKRTQGSVDSMIRVVREDSQGIRVIKALSKVDYERRRYDKANKELMHNEQRASTIMAASNPIFSFLLNLGLVGVILVGSLLVNDGLSEPGKIIAFIQYFVLISNAMLSITRVFVHFSKGMASAGRIAEVVRTEPDLEVESEEQYPNSDSNAHIVFDDVCFSYLGKKDNLSHISFSLDKGATLGIIGATGSGKTTLIQLLMRFYDTDSGNIFINGRNIRTIPFDELNNMFGVVMQNDFIYAGSIADNIRFGRDIDDESIHRAAELAQASEFILAYEDKFDHHLQSKGSNLSGGQKQRIFISRALAGNPDILVLDDSSSALDYKTDANLRKSIREHMADTTSIVVAQRVSSVMNSDLIMVLDEGKIIGIGTHDELMRGCDIYREISESQIGGAFLE